MTTRFDNTKIWVTADYRSLNIRDMETPHLINILKMFATKPEVVISMLVKDIEDNPRGVSNGVWTPNSSEEDVVKASVHSVTSLTASQIVEYALTSPLGHAIAAELEYRGVNLRNLMDVWKGATDEGANNEQRE